MFVLCLEFVFDLQLELSGDLLIILYFCLLMWLFAVQFCHADISVLNQWFEAVFDLPVWNQFFLHFTEMHAVDASNRFLWMYSLSLIDHVKRTAFVAIICVSYDLRGEILLLNCAGWKDEKEILKRPRSVRCSNSIYIKSISYFDNCPLLPCRLIQEDALFKIWS